MVELAGEGSMMIPVMQNKILTKLNSRDLEQNTLRGAGM
jgi:hypothetical protein